MSHPKWVPRELDLKSHNAFTCFYPAWSRLRTTGATCHPSGAPVASFPGEGREPKP